MCPNLTLYHLVLESQWHNVSFHVKLQQDFFSAPSTACCQRASVQVSEQSVCIPSVQSVALRTAVVGSTCCRLQQLKRQVQTGLGPSDCDSWKRQKQPDLSLANTTSLWLLWQPEWHANFGVAMGMCWGCVTSDPLTHESDPAASEGNRHSDDVRDGRVLDSFLPQMFFYSCLASFTDNLESEEFSRIFGDCTHASPRSTS